MVSVSPGMEGAPHRGDIWLGNLPSDRLTPVVCGRLCRFVDPVGREECVESVSAQDSSRDAVARGSRRRRNYDPAVAVC
jgi:hypothetical protein